MLTQRPTSPPDVYGEVVDITDSGFGTIEIFYKLLNGQIKSWIQPLNSGLTEHNFPDWLNIGSEFCAWSQNISTTRKKEYDWMFVEPMTAKIMREINNSTMSPLTRKLKKKNLLKKIADHQNTFQDLFTEVQDLLDE